MLIASNPKNVPIRSHVVCQAEKVLSPDPPLVWSIFFLCNWLGFSKASQGRSFEPIFGECERSSMALIKGSGLDQICGLVMFCLWNNPSSKRVLTRGLLIQYLAESKKGLIFVCLFFEPVLARAAPPFRGHGIELGISLLDDVCVNRRVWIKVLLWQREVSRDSAGGNSSSSNEKPTHPEKVGDYWKCPGIRLGIFSSVSFRVWLQLIVSKRGTSWGTSSWPFKRWDCGCCLSSMVSIFWPSGSRD